MSACHYEHQYKKKGVFFNCCTSGKQLFLLENAVYGVVDNHLNLLSMYLAIFATFSRRIMDLSSVPIAVVCQDRLRFSVYVHDVVVAF